jgi:hypothetical protein
MFGVFPGAHPDPILVFLIEMVFEFFCGAIHGTKVIIVQWCGDEFKTWRFGRVLWVFGFKEELEKAQRPRRFRF